MLPLVSVAIPVYNGENYMRDAIDSVLAQTYPSLDVLVVNDGSQDDGKTEQIAQSYGDRIRYFSKSNGGVASALNMALKESQGDYFCWLSHDDIYLPEKIAKQIDKLLSLPDPNSIVFCRHAIINPDGKYLYDAPPPPKFSPHHAAYQLILGQWLHCCTILAPKSLYLESGCFREDLPTTQDYDLLVKIGLKHPFVGISDILLKARSHPDRGSLTIGHLKEFEHFFEEHIPLLSEDYMHKNFTCQESIDAFLALGSQMRNRHFADALLSVVKQLINCESQRAEPEVIMKAIHQLTMSYKFYIEEKLKTLARKLLSPKARYTIKNLRNSLQHKVISSQPSLLKNEQLRLASLNFVEIYQNNGFLGTESRSGGGSTLFQTRVIREEIPKLLEELEIRHILDVPCGDWNWISHINLSDIYYIGGDIVQDIIDTNNKSYGNEKCKFEYLNIITGTLPKVDLILCRDCLVHLNFADGLAALEQFRKSGAKWLLSTTFTERNSNIDLYQGNIWRPLNLEKSPYNLPKPERYINEGCTEGEALFGDKCLGLWQLN